MTINFISDAIRTTEMFGQLGRRILPHPGRGRGSWHGPRGGIHVKTGPGHDTVNVNGHHHHGGGSRCHGEPVAANEHGRIWSDPHFKGGDGGRFDIQGEAGKHYDLLSDSGLRLNGRFDHYGHKGTAVGKTGLTVEGENGKTSEISFSKDGTATLDGKAMEEGGIYILADGGIATLNGKTLSVTTGEGYKIEQEAKSWLGDDFINIDVKTGANGVDNGRMPGGLLGHTFDADSVARNGKTGHGAQGEGAIDGKVGDYETGGLFKCGPHPFPIPGPLPGPFPLPGPHPHPSPCGPIHISTGPGDDTVNIGGGHCCPGPMPVPEKPVAANEKGRIWGDPHFEGGDGGKYDVQGEAGKIYDLLSDSGLELRGQFDGWGKGVTVVGETGLTVGKGMNSDNINFRKDGAARINGQLMEQGKTYELADGGTAKLKGKTLTITTAEGYTIKQSAQTSGKRGYINIDVKTGADGVGHGQMPGGLLGQTFDADSAARNGKRGRGAQGEGAIDGKVGDYERPALDPMNDNRGTTDETDDRLDQFMEKFQELMDKFMELLNKMAGGDMHKPGPAPKMDTYTNTGSGNDDVRITAGGRHNVRLGSGNDHAYVGFKDGDTGNTATIRGGSGHDTVTLKGAATDYNVRHAGRFTVYTDQDGNSIRVARDVEHVQFETNKAA